LELAQGRSQVLRNACTLRNQVLRAPQPLLAIGKLFEEVELHALALRHRPLHALISAPTNAEQLYYSETV
jgi:hypothetical protein